MLSYLHPQGEWEQEIFQQSDLNLFFETYEPSLVDSEPVVVSIEGGQSIVALALVIKLICLVVNRRKHYPTGRLGGSNTGYFPRHGPPRS